jgi:ABC-type glutathione transport system ATPase component
MSATALLEIRGLCRRFADRHGSGAQTVRALDGVDLTLPEGGFHALVGGSGSGKSTLARCLAGLDRPDAGSIRFRGVEVTELEERQLRAHRRRVQLIFQDPGTALSPRLHVWQAVAEPMAIAGRGTRIERRALSLELMAAVGLHAESSDRSCLELSGGQKQRLAIARALAVEPTLMILDEALSGLDASMQGQMLNLLRALQAERAFSCLLVAHDLALVASVAEEVAVMHAGRIVERGTPDALSTAAAHPHTRALVAAARRGVWHRVPEP